MAAPLDTVNDIRSMDAAGRSRSEAARVLRASRNTVAKYADMEDVSPAAPVPQRRGGPALEGNEEWVAGILEADPGTPRKQRHTARRTCDRLGAPKQVEYLAGYLKAERPGRKASKRAAPLRRCAPPAPKTFGGHDAADRSWGGADSHSNLFGPPICPHSPIGKATAMVVTYDPVTISCHLYGDIKSYVIIYLRKQWAT